MEKNKFLLLIFLLLNIEGFTQVNRYIVHFSDKDNSSFSISTPTDFLSDRAIQRRAKQGIAIVENDLPVNADYIAAVEGLSAAIFHKSKWFNAILIEANEGIITAIETLEFVDSVSFVAPDQKLTGRKSSANKFEATLEMKGIENSPTNIQNNMLGTTSMHAAGFKGEGMLIGVFDVGFLGADDRAYFDHLFDDNKIVGTYDFVLNDSDVFVSHNHGRRVLFCIASYLENTISGTAPNANFILCRTEDVDTEYRIEEYNWLFAAEYADSTGVDIINTSLGYNEFTDPSMNYTKAQMDGKTTVISKAAQTAFDKGILLVVSAGNSGNDSWQIITAPADVEDVLTIGAIRADSIKGDISSIGNNLVSYIKPDVVALGVSTTVEYDITDGSFLTSSGTSFASPLVAGLAAGIWQTYPDKTNREMLELLRNSGHTAASPNNFTGYGIPSYNRAKFVILSTENNLKDNSLIIYPNPTNTGITIQSANSLMIKSLDIYNSLGQRMISRQLNRKSSTFSIDLNALPSGLYFLSVNSEQKKIKFFKN